MSKTAFYFRTIDEFNKVYTFIHELNIKTKKKYNMSHYSSVIRAHSRYVTDSRKEGYSSPTIPKKIPSKKKYIGMITANKHSLVRAEIDIEEILKQLKIELVGHDPGTPKYTGEKSFETIYIKNYTQFRKIVSVFNKQFGHGNWHIRGPKKLQKQLLQKEQKFSMFGVSQAGATTVLNTGAKKNDKGIKVTIVVNQPNAAIKKLLFKIALMI